MRSDGLADLQTAYDRVVDDYVEKIFDELRGKPLDRQLLDRFAVRVQKLGPACDMGCGPGQVARYLQAQGASVCGIDLSPAMVEAAGRLNPGIEFNQGNMTALDVADEAWGGIAAFYSIIHLAPPEIVPALREWGRVLKPGGLLLLAFHIGDEVRHLDEWWGHPVSVDFYFFRTNDMTDYLRQAGFEIEEVIERPPYEGVEVATQRAYLVARKPLPA